MSSSSNSADFRTPKNSPTNGRRISPEYVKRGYKVRINLGYANQLDDAEAGGDYFGTVEDILRPSEYDPEYNFALKDARLPNGEELPLVSLPSGAEFMTIYLLKKSRPRTPSPKSVKRRRVGQKLRKKTRGRRQKRRKTGKKGKY